MRFLPTLRAAALLLAAAVTPALLVAQAMPRPIHREIPLTNMIRRAFAAGTRDSTGRPGAAYWQPRTDYTIQARLDPSTGILTGRESVRFHNTSGNPLRQLVLRLDQNIYAPNVARACSRFAARRCSACA